MFFPKKFIYLAECNVFYIGMKDITLKDFYEHFISFNSTCTHAQYKRHCSTTDDRPYH